MQVFSASQIYTPGSLHADSKAGAPGMLHDNPPLVLTLIPKHQPKYVGPQS